MKALLELLNFSLQCLGCNVVNAACLGSQRSCTRDSCPSRYFRFSRQRRCDNACCFCIPAAHLPASRAMISVR